MENIKTERLREIVEHRSPSLRWGEAEKIAAELLANREAQPVAAEIYAELYRLRIENKGPNGFETWRDAAIFERNRRADAERKLDDEEMTYLEAMSLLTTDDAQNLSAIEAFRRGASYNGKINAHALRNSMRYQFLRDKDDWGCDNETGLVEWDELIELEGNYFDAAIDARMASSDVTPLTAPPAPAVPDISALTELIVDRLIDCSAADDDSIADAETFVYNACRAAMLAQPQIEPQNIPNNIPDGLAAAVNRLLDSDGSRGCFSAVRSYDAREDIERMLAAAPEATSD